MVIDARGPSIGPSVAEILASHAGGTGSPTKTAARVADAIAARGDDGTWLSTVPRDQLLAAAEEIEKRPGARTLPLYGVPFGVKDSIDVEGVPTTLSCPDYAYVASTTAPVVRRLLDAGALNKAGVVYEGLQTLGEGAILVGLVLGTMVTFILEKKFLYAAIASAGAVLSFIGLHSRTQVAWAAIPKSRLVIFSSGSSSLPTSFLPGAKDPVDIDESDIVAGHD